MQKIDLNRIRFVKYDPLLLPLIKVSNFDCGHIDLNCFLKEDLESHREQMMSQSRLVVYEEKIIGYFTLQADAIKLSDEERKDFTIKGFEYKTFPAVKIGRFAIHKEYQRSGVGTLTLKLILGIIRNSYGEVAVRFVTVDAKKEKISLNFYTKFGFVPNEVYNTNKTRETESMRYDLYNPLKELPSQGPQTTLPSSS